jgi:hypothetical protein
MRLASHVQRIALLLVAGLLVGLPSLGVGCVGGSDAAESALRQRFPAEAGRVLDDGDGFVVTERGFESTRDEGRLRAILPGSAGGSITIAIADGGGAEPFSIRVRELGATGAATIAGRAIAYRRAAGSSFWSTSSAGVEEWLHLDAGDRSDGPAAAWAIEGGALRQVGDAVEIADESGLGRVRVTAPRAFAVGGRAVPVRLTAVGARIELAVDEAGEVLVDPAWIATGAMSVTRQSHTAVSLPSGDVFVVGGVDSASNYRITAETYSATTGVWSAAGAMIEARTAHAATALASGAVLISGGRGIFTLSTSQAWDPTTSVWGPSVAMVGARYGHTATLLPSGKVLAVGGYNANLFLATTEIYDPAASLWTAAAPLGMVRGYHSATLLSTGKVLVAGGTDGTNASAATELFDPVAGAWSAGASMTTARYGHTATTLANGTILVVGGSFAQTTTATAEIYNPQGNSWAPAGSMTTARTAHAATLLVGGKVLVTGGFTGAALFASAEIYDPQANTWSPAAAMTKARASHTATLLPNGKVLAAGGGTNGNTTLSSAELYSPLPIAAPCGSALDCASGFCADGVCCATACNAGACDACSVAAGSTADGTCTLLSGTTCNDGNGCTQNDVCQSGVCVGANPIVCGAPTACQTAGSCAPQTGLCVFPAKPDGTMCNDGNGCTQTDTCVAGACAGANPVVCPAPGMPCFAAGVCNPQSGVCSAAIPQPNGAACDDGNACTQSDTCQGGACNGGPPVICAANACQTAGACDPVTGCSALAKPDGTACNDASACTANDSCKAGVCTGTATVCAALDSCHAVGVCNPQSGVCSNPGKPDGASCDDGNACSTQDYCISAFCLPGPSVICAAMDQCHIAGLCDPQTGCSNPQKPTGALCDDGNPCTQVDSCKAGACQGKSPVVCAAVDACHAAGTCNVQSGTCSTPALPDGTVCPGGTCSNGVCGAGSTTASSAASSGSTSASGTGVGGNASSSASSGSGGTGAGGSGGSGGSASGSGSGTSGTGADSTSTASSMASGSGGERATTASGSGGESSSSSGPGSEGSCGCGVAGSPTGGAMWLALGLVLVARRKREREGRRRSPLRW